ncbi:MAG: hypothetical protein HKL91_02210 [Candidatus Eremiobacteraeota bacterium]|uniref:Uncharacterized protein n=1 Tax=mine drainage metagenome TaxID=410659 RepID=E6PCQ8_9ZZZZ|nr:hypothetical protein [Candidatus Eremiobacteraeota bacterium]
MKGRTSRIWAAIVALTLALNALLPSSSVVAANGHDNPGTQITNNATATYKDAGGNTYSTTSNTVTTTVQNAPTMTDTAGTGTQYAPGSSIVDTYTLANTGNANGTFHLDTTGAGYTAGVLFGGGDSGSATLGGGPTSSSGCGTGAAEFALTIGGTTTYCDNVTDLNTFLAAHAVTAGSSATLNVYYSISNSATTGQTVTSSISPNLSYAAAGSAPAETTSDVPATETNTVVADARLDLQKTSSQNATTGDITYTILAHDGGAKDAKDLASVKALLGASVAGLFISDRVPEFGGSPLKLSNSGAVSITNGGTTYGFPTNAVADLYYTTDTTGATGWTKAAGNLSTTGNVAYIGVFIHGGTSCSSGAGWDLCADATHPSTPGNVPNPALSFSFVVQQPSGAGSANAGAVTNLANGVIGDNQTTEHILGPGIPSGTADSGSSTPLTTSGQGINNTTLTSTGGASNQVSNQALSAYSVLNGPFGNAGSNGSFDGDTANDPQNTSNDFTAWPFGPDAVVNTSTTPGTPTTTTTTAASATLCIPHTLQNTGNKNDQYNIAVSVPADGYPIPKTNAQGGSATTGWTVGVYSDSACTSPLGGAADSTTTSTASNVALTSGSSLSYYTKYIAPSGLPYFQRFDTTITATSVGDATKFNTTHDELYSSFVALTKSQTIPSNGCPAGVSPSYAAGTACPGGQIAYSVDYRNLVLGLTDTAASFTEVSTQAGSLLVTDDGSQSTSATTTTVPNWATFATMTAAPSDTNSAAAARATQPTFTFYTGVPASATGSSTFATTDSKFSAVIGGASFVLVPKNYPGVTLPTATQDWQGSLGFTIQVN